MASASVSSSLSTSTSSKGHSTGAALPKRPTRTQRRAATKRRPSADLPGASVSDEEFTSSFWPSREQKLLLRAAVLDGDAGADAWRRLRPEFRIDGLESSSYALLPLLYRQLE